VEKYIHIKTKRFSAFFELLLSEYKIGSVIEIDNDGFSGEAIDHLMSKWCVNKNIAGTKDFKLRRRGEVLFSFHDSPMELFAKYSELNFVLKAYSKGIIKYKVVVKKEKFFTRIFKSIFSGRNNKNSEKEKKVLGT